MMSFLRPAPGAPEALRRATGRCRVHLLAVAAFSALLNILSLTPTIYMMQVYDRVLGSGSLATLAGLSAICLFGIGVMSLLDWLRTRLLIRVTARFDRELSREALSALLSRPDLSRLERAEGMRRFDTLRQGLGGQGIVALFDIPWTPIFLIVSCLIHPAIGALSLAGCIVLLGLAWSNERATHARSTAASEAASIAYGNQTHIASYANEIRAMGMRDAMIVRQLRERDRVTEHQIGASFSASGHTGLIKFLRMALQSAALGLGALLAVRGSISPGAVFAAGLLLSRSVAPIEQLVAGWKNLAEVRDAHATLIGLLDHDHDGKRTRLPDPSGRVTVENLTVLTPQDDRIALSGVSFAVEPGELIGVVGMSGAGKSTLLRALAGARPARQGAVRFDGAAYTDWDPDQIARAIGYVPQEFVLFPGTVKENISRFDADVGGDAATIDAAVVAAATEAAVHDMIVRLPQGYDTRIGHGGVGLSAGQTQRIALARALYGRPRILILDEPNAHLDTEAEYRFVQLLAELKRRGTTVIMAAHSSEVLASADRLLLLDQGRVARFGSINAKAVNVPQRPHPPASSQSQTSSQTPSQTGA